MEIDGGDDAHVGLAPLAAAIGRLGLEELERVEAEMGLWNLERAPEDGAGFVLHEEELAVGVTFGEFLEQA